jgi:hypothetical protein
MKSCKLVVWAETFGERALISLAHSRSTETPDHREVRALLVKAGPKP